jgi:pSer/pThr/pTyr-binding forkhead associated (FHA) protein
MAERGPSAYLVYADEQRHQRSLELNPGVERVRVGRGKAADLRIAWDREVSGVHAELERLGDGWALIDDGLSANGTYLNGERLSGRRRLAPGDQIRVGSTELTFRALTDDRSLTFIPELDWPLVELSRMQRRVLVALCRPSRDPARHGAPATNQEIANELHLSVGAVKAHLRVLFGKFAIADLPQNQKRARLVELAFERGAVDERDLAASGAL